jgi:hypothetical protein
MLAIFGMLRSKATFLFAFDRAVSGWSSCFHGLFKDLVATLEILGFTSLTELANYQLSEMLTHMFWSQMIESTPTQRIAVCDRGFFLV